MPVDLEDASTWAQCMDLWQFREGDGEEGEKFGKRKQKGKMGNIFGEPGPSTGGQIMVV